jgi:tetratricopeptide (TPR) repeat protein
LALAYRFLGRYEDAIEVSKEVLKRSPNNLSANIYLTATYSALGREEEAHQQAERLLELHPTFSLAEWEEMLPITDEAEAKRFVADLRKAGLR